MKLSEMNVRQMSAALCQLVQPMSRIAKDETLNSVFSNISKAMKERESMTDLEKFGMLLEAVPALLTAHYGDMIRIIAIMTERTDAEVEEMNAKEMIDELRKSIDRQFVDFFRSSAVTAQTLTGRSE